MSQPIIRGIQAVGAVDIKYRYNNKKSDTSYLLPIPSAFSGFGADANIECGVDGVDCCGYRLDGEFLRAMQQIASSVQIPILGGGAVALTNNNRSGTLRINATRTSTPTTSKAATDDMPLGSMFQDASVGVGPKAPKAVPYDLVLLAQIQQAQEGGDSLGARLTISFQFCGRTTKITFEGCTVASVDPVGLSGNDAVDYGVAFNYLDWSVEYEDKA